jgi:hypothetical protein
LKLKKRWRGVMKVTPRFYFCVAAKKPAREER